MFLSLISLVLPLALIAAVVAVLANRQALRADAATWLPRRVFTYTLAFAALVAVLYAVAGLLALIANTMLPQSSLLVSANDVRTRASFYLAALIVGLPIWLWFWLAAQRRAAASPDERDAGERRLFLAAAFATTSVVALFALQALLDVVLTLPAPAQARPAVLDGVAAAARLLVWGAAWLALARLGWRERSPRDHDAAHDLAVYVLAGFALSFFTIGLSSALREIVGDLVGTGQPALLTPPTGSAWATWGAITAWMLAGGAAWAAIWRYDLARGGRRMMRVIYLYTVLAVAVPTTLAAGGDALYELLRRLFGYQGDWLFLRDTLPWLLVAGIAWAHHWAVMRRQAILDGAAPPRTGGIAWPRRPAIALMTLLGLAIAAPAFISLLWLGLDFLLGTGGALSGSGWWRDRASIGLAGAMVGAVAWLAGWARLQGAATADPLRERSARARRLLLQTIVLVSALCALGFTIAVLWQALQMLLGVTLDASALGTALKYLATAVITAGLAAYYGLILRRDVRLGPAQPVRVRVVALVAPRAGDLLVELRRRTGLHIDVLGYLPADPPVATADPTTLHRQLDALGRLGHADAALLILRADGGVLYPFDRADARRSRGAATTRTVGAAMDGPTSATSL